MSTFAAQRGLRGAEVHESGAAAARAEVRPELHREAGEEARVDRHAAEADVRQGDAADGLGLVEEVAAVPVPELRRLPLHHRAGPVVGLVVEALEAGRRHARRLLGEEVDDAEVGHVLAALVELDAERVGARVRELSAGAHALCLAAERVLAVVGSHRGGRDGGAGERHEQAERCERLRADGLPPGSADRPHVNRSGYPHPEGL